MASRPSKGGIGIDCKVRSNLAKHMERFDLNDIFQAECLILEEVRIAEVYYLARNSAGGATLTPVARFFVGDLCSSKASILTGESIASCASISFHPSRCCWATSS